jgi:hypothetical protein
MRAQTITLIVLASYDQKTIAVRPGMTAAELRRAAGLPDDYTISLEPTDYLLRDDEDLSGLVSEGEVLFASRTQGNCERVGSAPRATGEGGLP